MRKVWEWENPIEVPLSNGVVMLSVSVPPYAYADLNSVAPPPPTPVVELTSASGSTERATALPGSPEYDKYWQKRKAYDSERRRQVGEFRIDYGCLGWKYPGTEKFVSEPPEDWEPPEVTERWNTIPEGSKRRVLFIKYVLIRTEKDDDDLSTVWDEGKPPTKEERQTAADPFGSKDQTDSP